MYKIYIDEKEIDTFNNKNIVLNAILFDISSPEKRGLQFSNVINLPKTEKNIDVFEFFDNDLFYKEYTADIYDGTMHIIRGNVKVIEISDYIKIQIVEIFKQISENLKKPLYELDLGSSDFVYTLANYNTLKTATTGIWSWELLDCRTGALKNPLLGALNGGQDPDLGLFRPSYIGLSILEQMFTEQGLQIDTSELNSILDDLRMPSNNDNFWIAFHQQTTSSTSLTAGNPLQNFTPGYDFYFENTIPANNDFPRIVTGAATSGYRFYPASTNVDNCKFAIEIDIDETAVLEVRRVPTPFTGTTEVIERHVINQTGVVITQEFDANAIGVDYHISFTFDVNVTINDIVVVAMASENELYISDITHTWVDNTRVVLWRRQNQSTLAFISIVDGLYVKTRYNLPDWTQLEFLQELWKMFNLSITFEGDLVKIAHNDLDTAVQINDYVSSRKALKNNAVYAERNYFQYSNENIGNFTKEYVSKVLEKDFIILNSEASNDVVAYVAAVYITMGDMPVYDIQTSNLSLDDRLQVEPRFFVSNANPSPGSINASKLLLFDGLSFVDLYDDYYKDYYDYLQNSKLMTYNVKIGYPTFLKIIDAGKIYDSVLGRELTVLTISKYNANTLTTITAITREI